VLGVFLYCSVEVGVVIVGHCLPWEVETQLESNALQF